MGRDPLRIGYDASVTLAGRTGIGRYTLELLKALVGLWAPDVEFVVLLNSLRHRPGPEHEFLRGATNVKIVERRLPGPAVVKGWATCGLPTWERLVPHPVDVVHGPAGYLPPTRGPVVATIHDLSFLREAPGTAGALAGDLFRAHWPRRLPQAAAIITPTEAVARDLCAAYADVKLDRVHPIWHGGDHLPDASPLGGVAAAAPYLLAVGGKEPRKRLSMLLDAYSRVDPAPPLKLVGVAHESDFPRGVEGLGRVDDADLARLYAGAIALLVASREEGFCFPIIEAARAGCPTICRRDGALAEVGAEFARFVDGDGIEAFAGAIRGVIDAPPSPAERERLSAGAGRHRWSDCARATLEVLRSAAR